jgi:uncharacterized protein YebE (UPF0316 family)
MGPADFYAWVILPFIVFFARVADVTLGTLRIIFTSRGKRNVAPFLGFVEVFIWIVVIAQIVNNIHSITAFIGYAAGFATGTYVGMLIEDRLAIGTLLIRVFLTQGGDELKARLSQAGFGVTIVDGEGATGPVKLIHTIIPRKDYPQVSAMIHELHPSAFYSIEEIRSAESGIFPPKSGSFSLQNKGRKTK